MLQVNELNQYYGGSHILRGVSFEAVTGEVTCLLGRNGVGKTTLLKCLMGLIPAKPGRSSGRVKDHPQQAAPAGAVWRGVRPAGPRDFPAPDRGGEPSAGDVAIFRPRGEAGPG